MANSLIDLYLGDGKAAPEKDAPSSLIDMYLGSKPTIDPNTGEDLSNLPHITVTPRAPTSNDPIENAQQAQESAARNTPVNVPSPSILSQAGSVVQAIRALPTTYGQDVYRKASEAGQMASEGLSEIASNKSASGLGKAAMGLIGIPSSLITAPIEEATNFGNKILPAATSGLPTDIKGNPLSNKPFNVASPSEVALSGIPVGKALSIIGRNALGVISPNRFSSIPTNKAISAIIDTIGQDNLPSVIQELKSNPRLSLMDTVPATRQMAQKLITNEGPHQNKFEKFVTDRVASGKDATSNIYDQTMGTPVNVVDKVNVLKKAASDVGSKEIQPAVNNAGFVDVSNVINNIDKKLKPGVNSVISAGEPLALGDIEKPLAAVRQFIMDEKSVRTDPKSLHQFQAALRAKAEDLLNSTDGQNRQKGYALMSVRNDIVNAIDEASGGKYKPALSKFRDEKQVENAFNMGQLVTRNKLGRLEDSPEFWDNWVKNASPQELEAAREGARLAVQHQIAGFKAGARKGQDIVESEFNRDKLSSLFGEKQVDKMAKELKDERNIAITNSKLIDNSQSAQRLKADSRVDLPVKKDNSVGILGAGISELANMSAGSGVPGLGTAAYLGAKAASAAKFKYADLPLAKARNSKITDYLTATGEDRADLIKILESHIQQPKLSLVNKARLALPTSNP